MSRHPLDFKCFSTITSAKKQLVEQVLVSNDLNNDYTKILIDNITRYESQIDSTQKLYGITWCPDPKQLPDSSFDIQHDFNVELLSNFLKGCLCGLFCVEATQNGVPHYHGWYQVTDDPILERYRLTEVKTLKRFGRWEPKEIKHHKIGCFTSKGNGLWYYKKEYLFAQRNIMNNPIHSRSEPVNNWGLSGTVFFATDIGNRSHVYEIMRNRDYAFEFYNKK